MIEHLSVSGLAVVEKAELDFGPGLNAITGSRKVGMISHVERLRERIRTHIEVARNGHDPSEVKVVVRGAF